MRQAVLTQAGQGLGGGPLIVGLDPTGRTADDEPTARRLRLAPRPSSLAGASVGLVINGLGRGDDLLDEVLRLIGCTQQLAGEVRVHKPSKALPPTPEDWARLTSRATGGITAFGGCGSCSARSLRDSLELEWAGIPSVALIHEGLAGSARANARLSGMPDYQFITIPFPYATTGTWTDDEVLTLAAEITPAIVKHLTA